VLGRQLESLNVMKSKFATVLFITALSAVPAFGSSSLLTPGGVRYAIVAEPDRPQVQIARAEGDLRATLVAPSTQDAGIESQAQLAYDAASGSLYVAWVRENAGNAEIRFASVNVDGEWSSPRMVAAGSSAYRNLQFVLSHGEDNGHTTSFLHLAWWSVNGNLREPEYALFSFDGNIPLSAEVANLEDLAAANWRVQTSELQYEEDIVNPPLAMARNGAGVDVAFGAVDSTVLTRLNVNPRKVSVDVRIWKPLGRGATRTPRIAALVGPQDSAHGVIVNGRLALYTIDDEFRFMVLRNDNTWSDVHAVRVDDENTVQDLVRDLQHTVQELLEHDETEPTEEIGSAPVDR
jgi:hypothetical protein